MDKIPIYIFMGERRGEKFPQGKNLWPRVDNSVQNSGKIFKDLFDSFLFLLQFCVFAKVW